MSFSSNLAEIRVPDAFRAGFWIVLAGTFFVLMMAVARHLADDLHMLLVVFWRGIFGVMFMLPWLAGAGLAALQTRHHRWHALRAVFNYTGLLCTFYAATMIPLADLTAISFTRPIVASLLAIVVLHEAARGRRWAATFAGFAGALIIVRPGFAEVNPGVYLVFVSVICGSAIAILIKFLSRTDPPDTIAMYMVAYVTPIALVPALFVWEWPGWAELGWLVVLGALGTFSQRCLARAYHAADATVVLSFDFCRLPIAALIGFVLFGELPDVWVWVGGGVIVGSSVLLARREARAVT